jgi:hypothetical protein
MEDPDFSLGPPTLATGEWEMDLRGQEMLPDPTASVGLSSVPNLAEE